MLTITISKINNRHVVSAQNVDWLKENIGKPLKIACIDVFENGKIHSVTVRKEDGHVAVLFLKLGEANFTIKGVDGSYFYESKKGGRRA